MREKLPSQPGHAGLQVSGIDARAYEAPAYIHAPAASLAQRGHTPTLLASIALALQDLPPWEPWYSPWSWSWVADETSVNENLCDLLTPAADAAFRERFLSMPGCPCDSANGMTIAHPELRSRAGWHVGPPLNFGHNGWSDAPRKMKIIARTPDQFLTPFMMASSWIDGPLIKDLKC